MSGNWPIPRVLVLLPAHNEEEGIVKAVHSLLTQTQLPTQIVIIADNCTDDTVGIVQRFKSLNVNVIETVDNTARKSGALNYGIREAFNIDDYDAVLTMDADTVLEPDFLRNATTMLNTDILLGGISATYEGRQGVGETRWQRFVAALQRGEYARYVALRGSTNIHTMSGTSSLYRSVAVEHVLSDRGWLFDERRSNLVEDYELTLHLKALGWKCTINSQCVVETDLMPTVRTLLVQRQRWARGTLDEIRRRGINRYTRRSALLIFMGMIFQPLIYGLLGYVLWAIVSGFDVNLWLLGFWLLSSPFYNAFMIRRSVGLSGVILEASVIPRILYDMLRLYWMYVSLIKSVFNINQQWR